MVANTAAVQGPFNSIALTIDAASIIINTNICVEGSEISGEGVTRSVFWMLLKALMVL